MGGFPLQDIKRGIQRPVDFSRPSFTSFTCEMICNGQSMKPVKTQYDFVRGESVRGDTKVYIAIEERSFEIKCTVRHSSGSSIQYGGEVFIDKGEHPIVSFAEARGQNAGPGGRRSNFVSDSPDLDHIFWFGPGETEYTIHGFFVNPETERRFSFAPPPKREIREPEEGDPRNFQEQNKKIGWICVRFYQVDQLVDRSKKLPRLDSLRPEQGSVLVNPSDPSSKEKAKLFAVSVRPGDRVRTGPCTLKQACLLNHEDPIYESKINYASIDAMWTLNTEVFASPGAWGGVPLHAFSRADIRTRCIRCMMSCCERAPAAPSQLGQGVTVSEASHSNEPATVAVRDVVAAMDTILSRAASYMVCTGVEKPGNYGESLVQGNPMRRW
jgi:hypothetical protein